MYPNIEPYHRGFLKVSDVHTLYYEEIGARKGIPIVLLHGGPGGGVNPYYRRLFDPQKYRAILFDQRGSGQSTPFACIDQNDTSSLVEDIERLRRHLNIDKWIVMGGSWGSTLAIAYAITYTERVAALLLRGIFLAQQYEIDWLYGSKGAARIFPQAYKRFQNHIPKEEQSHLIAAYHRRLNHKKPNIYRKAAYEWNLWENSIAMLIPDSPRPFDPNSDKGLAIARIESHYFCNESFLPYDGYLLEEAQSKLQQIPTHIVNGRYDIVCPPQTAVLLHNVLPRSSLRIVKDAGHSTFETGIARSLITQLSIWNENLFS
ncbi:MAG: prolyl aminopeptidase [Proteobacteria bacterium]|nr:prolyl aminopeptidase [Pseudomonadota bacterium]